VTQTLEALAILDDYQNAALGMAVWDRLPPGIRIEVFRDTLRNEAELAQRLAPFDAIVAMRERTPFPASLIQRLPRLRLLITTGERNRSIDLAACAARGITVCGTPSVGHPTVDIAWGLIISLLRDIPRQQQALRAGLWQTGLGTALEGLTLGVVGLGKLGSRVARVGQAFGMEVLAWSQNLTEEAAAQAGVRRVTKRALLEGSDVVTLHLVLSDRTRGVIGAEDLALMKPTAYLVNTSRGPLVDRAALVSALEEGRIAGAGLDVFDEEPLPRGHPLLSAPNTVLTPHLGYVTRQNYEAYFNGALEAVEAFLGGNPIRRLRP
jgi:phosphoglycerate dehydrogenase-like enzyme